MSKGRHQTVVSTRSHCPKDYSDRSVSDAICVHDTVSHVFPTLRVAFAGSSDVMNDKIAARTVSDQERANWARLIDDHEKIAGQCAELVGLARQSNAQSAVASRKLIELAVTVADHLGVEDEVIDRTVVAMEAHCSADAIAMMEEDLDILRSDWKAFIGRWLPTISPKDWATFGVQAESMLDRLSQQVKLETELLYDHALRDGVVRPGGLVLH
ncbi:MAG: hypothetical protein EOP64_13335 [Sphingomonas sp.]|nr:MAG: hypothetical protein EOP64_13335 [Sphingomonas sp.]